MDRVTNKEVLRIARDKRKMVMIGQWTQIGTMGHESSLHNLLEEGIVKRG